MTSKKELFPWSLIIQVTQYTKIPQNIHSNHAMHLICVLLLDKNCAFNLCYFLGSFDIFSSIVRNTSMYLVFLDIAIFMFLSKKAHIHIWWNLSKLKWVAKNAYSWKENSEAIGQSIIFAILCDGRKKRKNPLQIFNW